VKKGAVPDRARDAGEISLDFRTIPDRVVAKEKRTKAVVKATRATGLHNKEERLRQ